MKKVFFIFMSIIQIVVSIYAFIIAPQVAELQMNALNESVSELEESMETLQYSEYRSRKFVPKEIDKEVSFNLDDLFNGESGIFSGIDMNAYLLRIIRFTAILTILLNVIIIVIASKNHVLRHKARIVAYYVILLFISPHFIVWITSLISLIVLLVLKRTTDEDQPIKAPKVEVLEYPYFDKKNKIKALIMIFTYAILHFVIPAILINLDIIVEKTIIEMIVSSILDLIVFGTAIYLYKDELKKGIEAFKNNNKGYRILILKLVAIAYACVMVFNVTRLIITQNVFSNNQANLNELNLLYIGILAVVWAPIVEELVFRASIRRFIKNKYLFIVISSIIFGVLHAFTEANLFMIAITSLPYIALGACLAVGYTKSNNILVDMSMHAINNFIAVVLMGLIFGF